MYEWLLGYIRLFQAGFIGAYFLGMVPLCSTAPAHRKRGPVVYKRASAPLICFCFKEETSKHSYDGKVPQQTTAEKGTLDGNA